MGLPLKASDITVPVWQTGFLGLREGSRLAKSGARIFCLRLMDKME
jgi:hypothetical protein